MLGNNSDEMATRGRSSERRLRKISLVLIYLFVCIHQGNVMGFESVYNTADHYWPMRNISDNTSSDVIGLAHASIPNGGVLNRTSVFGPAIMLDGLDDCIILDLLSEDCTNTPSKCRNGFTISFWLYYIRGEFLLCSGAYTNSDNGPGIKFTFDERKELFVLEISTLDYSWRVKTPVLRRLWVHVAFRWSMEQGVRLYLDGRTVIEQRIARSVSFERPRFSHGWVIGRPNDVLKLTNYGSFGISHLALWLRELTLTEVCFAYAESKNRDPDALSSVINEFKDEQQIKPYTGKNDSPTKTERSEATNVLTSRIRVSVNMILAVLSWYMM